MAPSRLAPVLALQVETWTPTDSGETSPVDSAHGRRKRVVGRGAYCKRVVGEIGHLRFAANGKEVHAQATAWSSAWQSALVNFLSDHARRSSLVTSSWR